MIVLKGPFRGARLPLDLRTAKRKILGVYEHHLNPWLRSVLPQVKVVWDVGASDGYFTFGCARALKRCHRVGHVIAFEPQADVCARLERTATHRVYRSIRFQFFPCQVAARPGEGAVSLDSVFRRHPELRGVRALVKIDVEGAELEVLKGAAQLLADEPGHHWLVEIHGEALIEPVSAVFHAAGRRYQLQDERPHWLLGREKSRSVKNRWLLTG